MSKAFMGRNFLLETDTAKHLFHDYAKQLPLVDYHCHIPPRDVYEDVRFDNLAEVWLGGRNQDGTVFGDHYKWRLMRSNGVPEEYITGNADGKERVQKFAEALEMAIGNPMVHWSNLELQRFFDIHEPITSENAGRIYDLCTEKLRHDPDMTVRGLIRKSNVAFIGTTDDPADTLEWHVKIAADPDIDFQVCPSFRPDKAIDITKPGFKAYIEKLAAATGREITCARCVCEALTARLELFASLGCRASDHGLDYVPYREGTMQQASAAFQKAMAGESLSLEEAEIYETAILLHLGKEYHRLGIAMQLHYSCRRNNNERQFRALGPDSGFDMIAQNSCGGSIAAFLSALDSTGECPKTILYSLNPADNEQLDTLLGCFQTDELPGKIQHGSGWWFNDTKSGMEAQMTSLANLGLLGNFIGMLTDSRSFLSYPRHEYFRRIFCNLVGKWVENGEYPDNEAALKKIVEGVCYFNAARYFNI